MSDGPNTPQLGEWVRWPAPDDPTVPNALRGRTVYGQVIRDDLVGIGGYAELVIKEGHPVRGYALTGGWLLKVPVTEVERGRWDPPPHRDVGWVPA
jgi:hypothetical protein